MRRRSLLLVVVLVLCVVAAACGQKSNVNVASGGGGGGGGGAGTGDGLAAGEAGGDDLGGGGGDLGAGGDTGATGGDTGGATGGATGGGDTGGATGGATGGGDTGGATGGGATGGGATATTVASGPGDRTGISGKTIKIGIHGPATGAGAPSTSFTEGAGVYWDYLKTKGGFMGGFNGQVVFEDDKFDPNSAVRVCKKMVEQDKVFLLIGAAGADQITACARYAASVNVPYLSAGVNESGLTGLKSYFALSMTYAQQAPLLAQMIAKQYPTKKKVGLVLGEGPSLNDAEASFKKAAAAAGLQIVHTSRISKQANQAEALSKANTLRSSGAEVVYFLSTPLNFVSVAQQGAGQGYTPQWVTPGQAWGINIVATGGCPTIGKARAFSTFPQLDAIDAADPEYQRAWQATRGKRGDDVAIGVWGLNKAARLMIEAAGPNVSRQSFVAVVESGRVFDTKVLPAAKFSPGNHFGGQQVHVVEADCGARPPAFKTVARAVTGF